MFTKDKLRTAVGVSGAVRTASKVGEKKEEGRRGRQRASDGKGERQS